jgi:hypothetical protein
MQTTRFEAGYKIMPDDIIDDSGLDWPDKLTVSSFSSFRSRLEQVQSHVTNDGNTWHCPLPWVDRFHALVLAMRSAQSEWALDLYLPGLFSAACVSLPVRWGVMIPARHAETQSDCGYWRPWLRLAGYMGEFETTHFEVGLHLAESLNAAQRAAQDGQSALGKLGIM